MKGSERSIVNWQIFEKEANFSRPSVWLTELEDELPDEDDEELDEDDELDEVPVLRETRFSEFCNQTPFKFHQIWLQNY